MRAIFSGRYGGVPRQNFVLAQSFRLTAASAGRNDAGRDDGSLAAADAAATRTEAALSAWLNTATTRTAATGKAPAAGKWTAAAATGHLAAGSTGSRRGVGDTRRSTRCNATGLCR